MSLVYIISLFGVHEAVLAYCISTSDPLQWMHTSLQDLNRLGNTE